MRIDTTVKTTKRNALHHMIIIYNMRLQVHIYILIYLSIPTAAASVAAVRGRKEKS